MEKELTHIKELLKGIINDTNANQIADISKDLDSLENEHKTLQESHSKLKDDYIDIVKNTSLKGASNDDITPPAQKSLDDIMTESLQKVVNKK